MRKSFLQSSWSRKAAIGSILTALCIGFALTACGDDGSSSPKGTGLPAEVGDMAELETYECGMDVIGEKVYVTELEENYECDGEKWFKSYDQTKPSSTKSSASKDTDGSCDSRATDKDGSSSDATTSSSSAKSSSSRPTEILEPEITVNETCTEVGACDAMVKTDISTWHFVRKDGFDRDMEYNYFVEGTQLMVKTIDYKGVEDIDTLKVYSDMTNEISQEYAFNAAKSTCKNGGGNDNKIKSCVKDTVKTLPKCNTNLEGVIGIDTTGIKVICRENEWQIDVEYGSLMDDRDGQSYKIVKIGDQWWMAENLNYADSIATPSLSGKSWCFNNEPDSCTKYGRLYTWAAAIDSVAVYDDGDGVNCGFHAGSCTLPEKVRGICPSGWHMPDTTEWNTLFDEVGGKGDAYGFSVLPAGYRHDDDGFLNDDDYATEFWSVTVYGDISAYVMRVSRVRGILDFAIMVHAFSVRCLKDDP